MSEAERCCRCGSNNVQWHAPSPLWNAVMRGGSINGNPIYSDMVCPTCFATIAEEAGVADGWTLTARNVHVELETVTPSGRVWSDEQQLWVKPPCCDLHGRNCESPSELCCAACTETSHFMIPSHGDGTVCSNPDLSGNTVR